MMANYYKAGPATESGVRDRIVAPSSRGDGDEGSWYVADNFVAGYPAVTADNWLGVDGSEYIQLGEPWPAMPINQQTAQDAYTTVLAHVGTSVPSRDSVDTRIIQEVSTGTTTYGNNGIISNPSDVGGWPVLSSDPAPDDDDHDGMPNDWELAHGLNPTLAADRNSDFDSDGYTNLEEYLNDIGAFPAVSTLEFNGGANNRFAQAENWTAYWQPSRLDTAVVNNGTVVVDAVGQHAGTLMLGNSATLSITAGWLKAADEVVIGDTATLSLSGGELTTPLLSKSTGGSMDFAGGVLHADEVDFDLVNNGGTLAPGNSTGHTLIDGDYDQNATSTLEIEIAALADFDTVSVTGAANLNGLLNVILDSGFTLSSGDSFEILTAGSLTNSGIALASGGDNDLFTLDVDTGTGIVTLLPASSGLTGDYNEDGVIDAADYTVWRDNFGETIPNDPTGGVATEADYDYWKAHFGESAGSGSLPNSAAVPEPSSVMLVLLGFATLVLRRR